MFSRQIKFWAQTPLVIVFYFLVFNKYKYKFEEMYVMLKPQHSVPTYYFWVGIVRNIISVRARISIFRPLQGRKIHFLNYMCLYATYL